MTVKLLTLIVKYEFFVLANRNVANYQFLLVYILRLRITNKTIQVDDIEFGQLWIPLCSVTIPKCNKTPSGISTLARHFAPARELACVDGDNVEMYCAFCF